MDVGENDVARNTIHDQAFNDYNEESDEDWTAGSDNNDSSDAESCNYEFIVPAAESRSNHEPCKQLNAINYQHSPKYLAFSVE